MSYEPVSIYYFDENGKYMVMRSTAETIPHIPVTVRYYLRFDTSCSEIGNVNDTPLATGKKKKLDKFNWYKLTLVRTGMTGSYKDWVFEGLEDPQIIPHDKYPVIDRELQIRLRYWHTKHCCLSYAKHHQNMYHRGHICYWIDPTIRDVSNVTAHIYGKAYCLPETLKNVLLIVHGEIEFVEVKDYGNYETAVSLFKND